MTEKILLHGDLQKKLSIPEKTLNRDSSLEDFTCCKRAKQKSNAALSTLLGKLLIHGDSYCASSATNAGLSIFWNNLCQSQW